MPADLLLYIIIAAGLVFWLKNILGTTDDEDDEIREKKSKEVEERFLSITGKGEKKNQQKSTLDQLSGRRLDLPRNAAFDNKTAENSLEDISLTLEEFSLPEFLEGAEHAFVMIVEAFADGDTDTLKDLLDPSVFDAFKAEIEARKKRGEKVSTRVQNIEQMDIVETVIKDNVFYIALRFTANEICVIRNDDGEILAGDPHKATQMKDVWVFGQPLKSQGPEWFLYETRDEEEEDHKTPLPEAGGKK